MCGKMPPEGFNWPETISEKLPDTNTCAMGLATQNQNVSGLEARGGIEPPIKVLQTFALPLGDRAFVVEQPPIVVTKAASARVAPAANLSTSR
jgi:hypothetical protein